MFYALSCCSPDTRPQADILIKRGDGRAKNRRIGDRHQAPALPVHDGIAVTANPSGNDRQGLRHLLDKAVGKALLVRGQHAKIGRSEQSLRIGPLA